MICEICKKTLKEGDFYRTKDNKCICHYCADRYPKSVLTDIGKFTFEQLRGVEKICQRRWDSNKYVFHNNVGFTDKAILINYFAFWFEHLESVKLTFHPREKIGNEKVRGWLVMRIRTKDPAVELNEVIGDEMVTVDYKINPDGPEYFMDKILLNVLNELNEMLSRNVVSDPSFLIKLAGSGNWKCYGFEKPKKPKELTDVEKAMLLFGLTRPFTEHDVDHAWKVLIKKEKIHPDEGGTNERFIEVEDARELLKKEAVGAG